MLHLPIDIFAQVYYNIITARDKRCDRRTGSRSRWSLFNLKVQELRQSLKPNTEITDKGGTV